MKRRLLFLFVLALALTGAVIAPRSTVAAPADCATKCRRDYERCNARGLDSTVCLSQYEACLASC